MYNPTHLWASMFYRGWAGCFVFDLCLSFPPLSLSLPKGVFGPSQSYEDLAHPLCTISSSQSGDYSLPVGFQLAPSSPLGLFQRSAAVTSLALCKDHGTSLPAPPSSWTPCLHTQPLYLYSKPEHPLSRSLIFQPHHLPLPIQRSPASSNTSTLSPLLSLMLQSLLEH